MVEPPRWADEQLVNDLQKATDLFRKERLEEPLEEYLVAFDDYLGHVEELFETTIDLTQLSDRALDVLTDPKLFEAFRYLAGPFISKDDLKTVADVSSLTAAKLRANPPMIQRIVEVVIQGLDRRRFPWIKENREPSEAEKNAAVLASAALMATQRVGTSRRNAGKNAQEAKVEGALLGSGFLKVSPRTISTHVDAPLPGEFCRECMYGSRKADFVVHLWDNRILPIECKVSNSSTNSVKRLNNDAAAKATDWIDSFGSTQVVPSAVLGGVYKLRNLKSAQDRGLTLFWAHDLKALTDWIEMTKR